MDIVKVYFHNTDIKPRVLLGHFLRFLGFYVVFISDKNMRNDVESLVDIYLIGDDFMKDNFELLESTEDEKSIFIFKDGWRSDMGFVRKVYFDNLSKSEFLIEVIQCISDIIIDNDREYNCLFKDIFQWEIFAKEIAESYSKNKILEASLFTRCFCKQENLYHWAMGHYLEFINHINGLKSDVYADYFVDYVLLYCKYEVNYICKMNSFEMKYDIDEMLATCDLLLSHYNQNEEINILKADILYELKGELLDACDLFADKNILHCDYANYKCGKIVKEYMEEYDRAIFIIKKAVQKQMNYFQAWYQLGDCYERKKDYKKAIQSFKKIYDILKVKYERHILAPLELEYLYKSIMRIAIIYKIRLMDYSYANQYNELAARINKENAIKEYVRVLWGDKEEHQDIINIINETIEEHVNIKLEEIY